MTTDPRTYQFDLPTASRPVNVVLPEQRYPGIEEFLDGRCTSNRTYHALEGIRAVVIHATAGASSSGAVSVMRDGKASFHWLIPDEDEPQHGHFVWECVPRDLAAWHVRNERSHPDVWNGNPRINHYSLGVELVNRQTSSDGFSDWQVEIAARLVRYCWSRYPNLVHVVSHAKLDHANRSDPGVLFPWDRFERLVLKGARADDPLPELVAAAVPAHAVASIEGSCCA